jgi:putative oxidoreductase
MVPDLPASQTPPLESAMNTSSTVSAQGTSASASINHRNTTLTNSAEAAGRLLLGLLFLLSGLGKLGAYSATAAYMTASGVPAALLPLVIATEVLGGLGIVLGFRTRIVAFLLAGFSLVTAITFHSNLADQIQMIMFFKNIAIAGGLLVLVANGAGAISLDARFSKSDSR